ncbi:MAG: zinc carboxypeptidase [Chitinophagaceae bacterium]|nr:zinc carboxypeptidase [Chitinophagaceae bacterium]
MLKKFCRIFFIVLLMFRSAVAQLKSPEQFLGYKVGSHFTPHWKLVDYYKHVAASVPSMVKLQQYGETNEGRPLLVVYVSSASNIANLESIRSNNLRLANMLNDRTQGNSANAPAIVWLSYNVHGNEASSSEASMLTLYALVDPSNTRTKQWLQNTVVIIDPCLNPDGRDRYVNWYNSVVGKKLDAALDAREHNEPWPGGRTNHYNFDLNRDWAWQTQIESQQRLKLYNDWLPQIHVDFHEQGINAPYYFAPAAEPYHEVITPWQRQFQFTIGRNHAKYFDERGWLYFTREIFDLYYPSYGDTYPIYNGAIGMTYEQGGGPAGGLGVVNREGDTLTLFDRTAHHFTTSLSTIEIASLNAAKLISEFQNFYRNSITNGVGDYQSYIIKNNPRDAEKINALLDLLEKNKIQYTTGKTANLRGLNYDNRKEETFSVASSDIVIPSTQPRSTLVKVLFEPNPKLSDSLTYDITAWAIPYVYGLKTYASKQKVGTGTGGFSPTTVNNPVADPYAYVVRWNGVQTVKLVSQLLQKGIKLRYNEGAFEVGGQTFDPGAILILKVGNKAASDLWQIVRELANKYNVQLTPVSTGFVDKGYDFGSSRVHFMQQRRIAMLTGEGVSSTAAGSIWHFFDQSIDYPLTLINANDITSSDWSKFDVLILPDGNYSFFNDKNSTDQFREWVSKGGHIIALEGAVAQLSKLDWAIKLKKTEEDSTKKNSYELLRIYQNRERDLIPSITPGSIFRVEIDNTHPLAFGYPKYYYTLKQDDNIYEFIKDSGWNVGVIKRERQVSGFVGSRLQKRLEDGLLFGVQEIGRGTVTYLADNVLFRNFWENGKLMFANAVFMVGR